jgi:hypothetical protein
MVTQARKNELTVQNQQVCAEMYANAREGKQVTCILHGLLSKEQSAIYWQNGASAHFAKTAYRMGISELLWPSK